MASHECYNKMALNETVLFKDLLCLVSWTLRGGSKRPEVSVPATVGKKKLSPAEKAF